MKQRFTPPESFEEYRLLRPLGQGAMGQVYLAHDRLLDRKVAVKFIAAVEPSAAAREQFFTEARAIARLSHPNVVAIYRVGEIVRRPYLVSEYVEGQSLDEAPRPLPWERALAIGVGLCRGLCVAHRRGVLHRDIKPANVMMTADGEVKLLDFGLAKLLAPEQPPLRPAEAGEAVLAATMDSRRGPELSSTPMPLTTSGPVVSPLATTDRAAPPETAATTGPGSGLRSEARAPGSADATPLGGADAELVGSPLYMAPELWRGEPATERSDLYALGTLLYELCAGRAPFWDRTLQELPNYVQSHDVRPLRAAAEAVDERLCAIIDRCLRRDPAARYATSADLREALEALTLVLGEASAGRAIPTGNPYRGLFCFEESERGLFFGRDAEVRAVLDRLRADTFVLVAGDSGVGKSSLCRAGVLAAVSDGRLFPHVQVVRLVPGRRPLLSLVSALSGVDDDEVALLQRLPQEPALLALLLRRRFPGGRGAGQGEHLVLFIDQLEELLTLADPAEARLCAEALGAIVDAAPGVRLLAAARSDYLTRLAGLPGLGPPLARALYLVSPLSEEGLRQAVVQPALAKGLRFETPELVESLVAAARAEGGLPLLQFALTALWDARDEERRLIPAAALARLGGVAGALARHADAVYFGLPAPERHAARRILTLLVTAEGTRARRAEHELRAGDREARSAAVDVHAVGQRALEALTRGRLLLARAGVGADGSSEGEGEYELAHEALLSGWGTLRELLHGDAELRLLRQRLEQSAREWERLARTPDLLWRERQLQQVPEARPGTIDEEQAAELRAALGTRELAFLDASRQAARRRRWTRWLVGLGGPLLVLAGYGGVRLYARAALQRQVTATTMEAEGTLSQARQEEALREDAARTAYARFDQRDREGGDVAWDEALRRGAAAQRLFSQSARTLETALTFAHGGDAALRRRFGEVLWEWSLSAERAHDRAQRDELWQRLPLYDPDGALQRRRQEPARLSLQAEATVTLERLGEDGPSHRRVAVATTALGRAPLRDVALPPGDYVLVLDPVAPGRTQVRYPLVLQRGEKLALDIALPLAAQVPPGFVYIPAGRFLFGSSGAEDLRRLFFQTAPMHEVRTGPYLIAREETTFADWITFLRTLPREERARRMPRAGGLHGAVALRELDDGAYELSLRPSTQEYRARAGEPIRYGKRDRRAVQDWLRFPVLGIDFDDAQAYVAWLARSGKVPGARLCLEYEWERAARGADDRLFPQGDSVQPDDANLVKTYGQDPLGIGPDEVGSHPASRSLFGVDDLVGNAFEWVIPSVSDRTAMIRGGSYHYSERSSASVNRQEPEAAFRDATVGLRVCADPAR